MKENILAGTQIFGGMSEKEISTAMEKLSSVEKKYRKGSRILHAGSTTDSIGLVLEGSVTIENNDIWGNRTILSHVGSGQFFAETYGFLGDIPLLVDVVANETCRILFLRVAALRTRIAKVEPWMMKLTMNLLMITTQKNLMLSGRSFQTSPRTIRGRVMAYLNSIAIQKNRTEFDIPFDRQQMADYLNVERTALSKELGKMKKDGLIDYHRRRFILLLP
ncbi:MAG: Crp/Fnr family transcriptional regulator [Lachnospiraceae bacterium]|nr:Crp/Fnr family transcriptional regulator [Lachnospiraceae bacterium]